MTKKGIIYETLGSTAGLQIVESQNPNEVRLSGFQEAIDQKYRKLRGHLGKLKRRLMKRQSLKRSCRIGLICDSPAFSMVEIGNI